MDRRIFSVIKIFGGFHGVVMLMISCRFTNPDAAYHPLIKSEEMTNEEIVLVKRSWRAIRNFNPVVIGDSFYSKLFSLKHSLRRMFPGVMHEHYLQLVNLLNLIIAALDQPGQLEEEFEILARKHRHYGLTSSHYELFEEAMLWTIERALGKDCNKQILSAWKTCYLSLVRRTIAVSETIAK